MKQDTQNTPIEYGVSYYTVVGKRGSLVDSYTSNKAKATAWLADAKRENPEARLFVGRRF